MVGIDFILSEIDELLAELASPISSQEVADGWTEESKCVWKNFFEDLKNKILNEESLPALNLVRGMDYWGIVRGGLLEKAAKISNELARSGPAK